MLPSLAVFCPLQVRTLGGDAAVQAIPLGPIPHPEEEQQQGGGGGSQPGGAAFLQPTAAAAGSGGSRRHSSRQYDRISSNICSSCSLWATG